MIDGLTNDNQTVKIFNEKKPTEKLEKMFKKNQPHVYYRFIKEKSREKFNNIYSDFQIKKCFGKQKKQKTAAQQQGQKFTNYNQKIADYLQNNDIFLDQETNQNTVSNSMSKQTINEKDKVVKYPVFDRLYNYGFFIKNKQQRARNSEFQQEKEKRNESHVLNKSMIILSSLNDRNNTGMKKYQNYLIKKSKNYHPENTFKPKLDHNSIVIASSLEPSYTRLTKKKKPKAKGYNYLNKALEEIQQKYIALIEQRQNSRMSLKGFKQKLPPVTKGLISLYNKGMEKYLKFEIDEEEEEEQKPKMQKSYSFFAYKPKFPNMQQRPQAKVSVKKSLNKSDDSIYQRQMMWKKEINEETERRKYIIDQEELANCTFIPERTYLKKSSSLKEMNVSAWNSYMEKRRCLFDKKRDDEKYRRKIFYENSSNSMPFLTIQQKKKVNLSGSFSKRKNSVKEMRKILKIDDFFNDNNEGTKSERK